MNVALDLFNWTGAGVDELDDDTESEEVPPDVPESSCAIFVLSEESVLSELSLSIENKSDVAVLSALRPGNEFSKL